MPIRAAGLSAQRSCWLPTCSTWSTLSVRSTRRRHADSSRAEPDSGSRQGQPAQLQTKAIRFGISYEFLRRPISRGHAVMDDGAFSTARTW